MMNDMTVNDYKALYDAVVNMSMDAEGFGLFDKITEEDVEKAKWIACIIDCINDVPSSRTKHIFREKAIDFDVIDFLDENDY